MRVKLSVCAVSAIGVLTLLLVVGAPARPTSFGDETKIESNAVVPDAAGFPASARPQSTTIYEGRVRSLLSRKDTFGFSVRRVSPPGEYGFYVPNNETNRTIIETVMLADKNNWNIRVYYDPSSGIAEAVHVWGW
jgi:hypothetical protein